MFSSVLKSIGFGLVVTGVQDNCFEESPSLYNWIATSVGGLVYIAGTYLECRNYAAEEHHEPASTRVIKQSLYHAGGVGVVNGITHFVKGVDTPSAKLASITLPAMFPAVFNELKSSDLQTIPALKNGTPRFFILLVADYFAGSGFKTLFNGSSWDLMTKIGFPIGFVVGILEFMYGRRNDTGLNLVNAINRRGIKIAAAMNFIFSLYDFVMGVDDKYTIADDALAVFVGVTLLGAIVEFNRGTATVYHDLERGEGPVSGNDLASISIGRLHPNEYGSVATSNTVNLRNKLRFTFAVAEHNKVNEYPYFKFLSAKNLAAVSQLCRKSKEEVEKFCDAMLSKRKP